jgi:hypothetical protein
MGYEHSASCKLVATHCACCRRPLVDAVSVETGMGPICRKKHGYDEGPAEHRERANQLVYWIAAQQTGDEVAAWVVELRELGFARLADVIIDRLDNVLRVLREGDHYLVRAPYRPSLFDAWRALPGQYWDKQREVRVVPVRVGAVLWELFDRHFPGMKVVGEPRPAPQPRPATATPAPAPAPAEVVIKIVQTDNWPGVNEYLVYPPFRDDLIRAWPQEVPGTTWDNTRRCRRVPLTSRDALWRFLKHHFVGAVVETGKGRITITANEPRTSTPNS